MPQSPPRPGSDSKQMLLASLRASLEGEAGAAGRPLAWIAPRHAGRFALLWVLTALAAAFGAYRLVGGVGAGADHSVLLSLNIWTACYQGAAIAMAGAASRDTIRVVERDILPYASNSFAAEVLRRLRAMPHRMMFEIIPLSFAIAATASAFAAVRIDLPAIALTRDPFPFDLLLFAAGIFYFAFRGSRSVARAFLLLCFARSLDGESESLYVLGASDSPLVEGLSRLGAGCLKLLTGIFILIASGMVLILVPEPFALAQTSIILLVLMPIAAFVAVGTGSFVYLRGEMAIRAALRRFTLAQAKPLQDEINALVGRGGAPSEDELGRIDHLATLQDRILAGGRYGSRSGTGLSLVLPLLLPAISMVKSLLEGK